MSILSADLSVPCALAVGSEGAGVSPLLAQAGVLLSIPTQAVESLNAAIACSITLYEVARQKRHRL